MKRTVFFTLLILFSLSIHGRNFLCTNRLEDFLKDVSLLTLGSLGNTSLAQEVGQYVGSVAKQDGYSYYLIGPLDTLSVDDNDYFYRVNKSPFITADIYEKFATGLGNAGIIPVFDGRGKIDTNLVSSLVTRKLTYPVLVEDEGKANLLRALGYKAVFIVEENGEYKFLNSIPVSLYWKIPVQNPEELRKKVLLNSIIYLGPGEVQIRKSFVTSGVVVFSDEEFVISEAKKALEKRTAPGRVPW
ncbi:hypothetical protein IB67_01820 [Fervidobacterium riparium]|nr:hypothetical protein IB67_01820 [Fervidobacterium riparium]